MSHQTTDTILMVRPANFGFNKETAENNAFQNSATNSTSQEIKNRARDQFDQVVTGLRSIGVDVIVYEDSNEPIKTDAIFPNNWFSTHEDGKLFLYPMFSPNRRLERSEALIKQLSANYQLEIDDRLLVNELADQFLEGTGSMILDRVNKVAYACYSVRTDPSLLSAWGEMIGYKTVGWTSTDAEGLPYYHTNVIMALGERTAIICTESIVSEEEKLKVIQSLESGGYEIVEISRDQVVAFAGNMLAVKNKEGESYMIMSTSAFKSLTSNQIRMIENRHMIHHYDIPTIEHFGGGSIRCMMAEIFLPQN